MLFNVSGFILYINLFPNLNVTFNMFHDSSHGEDKILGKGLVEIPNSQTILECSHENLTVLLVLIHQKLIDHFPQELLIVGQ